MTTILADGRFSQRRVSEMEHGMIFRSRSKEPGSAVYGLVLERRAAAAGPENFGG